MPPILTIYCGGSAFGTGLDGLRPWKPLLDCADAISLEFGTGRVHVQLGGLRRWVAFQRSFGGSPFACIGYQETVGAIQRGHLSIGGSNRQVLAWVSEGGNVTISDLPEGAG